ncbi:UDP-N-acetylmuramyl pentapeptide phosphotransferase [Microbacterium betulae]|uniref:UDP-N-acetylmuramyl pentapeptide phosphotransferase n=1 Tax=Microbacterium betulae TaxID=2981139 RepID=A0AA97I8D2_9MICO|nr:UDP-N-acetylmuramyl pentapeptide phosphotransferase [Microbacterium sp. AB]WOF24390.1 UDP-N-acetylmuramyl pentapeptide phosphotransferase [Microbacterium sp. AB]
MAVQHTAHPKTGAHAVVASAKDPARRPDVLFRVRRAPDHEVSAWWHIGAFVVTSAAVVALLSFIPG